MKKFLIILFLICLVGCNKNIDSLDLRMDEAITKALESNIHIPKYKDNYISYYVEPSIGRAGSSSTSHTFNFEGNEFVMNINVANIINESLFEKSSSDELVEPFITKSGTYVDNVGNEEAYSINVYKSDDIYLLTLDTDNISFYSYTNEINCALIAKEMLSIVRTITIDKQTVINDFNIKEVITYQPSYLDLFEEKIPESGSIEELIKEDDLLNEIENGEGGDN